MPRGCAGLCSWGIGRELHVVHDAHLFILQIHASSFEPSWQREMVPLFSTLCRVGWPSSG
jgi:hypothetical protein